MKNLKSQWKAFFLFCYYYSIDSLRVTSVQIAAYAQFLSRSLKSYASVLNYLSAVRRLYELCHIEYPSYTVDVKLTLKGIKRLMSVETKQASPLDPAMLRNIFRILDLSDPVQVTLWCAFLFLFFLMFRSSQLFPKVLVSAEISNVLRRGDIVITDDVCLVTVVWSKTIQFRERKLVLPLKAIKDSPLCPVSAFRLMCMLVPASQDQPAFGLADPVYRPVTYSKFTKCLENYWIKPVMILVYIRHTHLGGEEPHGPSVKVSLNTSLNCMEIGLQIVLENI